MRRHIIILVSAAASVAALMALGTTSISAEMLSDTIRDDISYTRTYDVKPRAHERVDRDAMRDAIGDGDVEQKDYDDAVDTDANSIDTVDDADSENQQEPTSQETVGTSNQTPSSSRIDQSVTQLSASLDTDPSTVSRQDIVDIALSRVGNSHYQHAGLGPSGFSCDGFTAWVYSVAGVRIFDSIADSSAGGQSAYISSIGAMKTSIDELQFGDVLFFGSSWSGLRHAAIYIGKGENGTPQMAHASGYVHPDGTQDGVVVGPLDADFLGGGSPLA